MIDHLVCIGSSAGGVEALQRLFTGLESNHTRGIILIQHMGPDQKNSLPEILMRRTQMQVIEACDKMVLKGGEVVVAPPGYHVLVEKDMTLSLSADERVSYARPSIDVTFESAAEVTFSQTIGIVLTGANSDGAQGLLAIKKVGGICICQDPAEAMADAMPRAAIERVAPQWILSLETITHWLNHHPRKGIEAL